MWIWITILAIIIVVQLLVIRKLFKRLFEFDDLFEFLVHDIDTNVTYFNKLLNTPLLENSPEIIEAQRNMNIMKKRLNEYVLKMEELTKKQLRKKPEKDNRPVVV